MATPLTGIIVLSTETQAIFHPTPRSFKDLISVARTRLHIDGTPKFYASCLDICKGRDVEIVEEVYTVLAPHISEIKVRGLASVPMSPRRTPPPASTSEDAAHATSDTIIPEDSNEVEIVDDPFRAPRADLGDAEGSISTPIRRQNQNGNRHRPPPKGRAKTKVEPKALEPLPDPMEDAEANESMEFEELELEPESDDDRSSYTVTPKMTTQVGRIKPEASPAMTESPSPAHKTTRSSTRQKAKGPAAANQSVSSSSSSRVPAQIPTVALTQPAPREREREADDDDFNDPDGRFRVHIEGPEPGQQAEFITRKGHFVKKVLAGACKTFKVPFEDAELYLEIGYDDDGEWRTDRMACDREDTVGQSEIKPGSRLVVVLRDEVDEDDE